MPFPSVRREGHQCLAEDQSFHVSSPDKFNRQSREFVSREVESALQRVSGEVEGAFPAIPERVIESIRK